MSGSSVRKFPSKQDRDSARSSHAHRDAPRAGQAPLLLTPNALLFLFLILGVALVMRLPFVNMGLPYFYHEDEAHHFNRTVNMTKRGDWNPHYFHKPSLHFYLRTPAVAAGFLNEVREGRAQSLEDIQTTSKYGLAGYAFTASHPGMVKWNRSFSVLLSLGLIACTFVLALQITKSLPASVFAGLLSAFSPDLVEHSAVIGVDILMSLMCLMAILLGVRLSQKFSLKLLFACGIFAGLAISSKYNAAPIAVLPVFACLVLRRFDISAIALSLISPVVGFLLGSPYVLSSFPLFLEHLGYEIWHYGTAGHVGHMAEPGLAQFLFYAKWLWNSAFGTFGTVALCLGILTLPFLRGKDLAIFLCFPALFIVLMLSQKANFTRNMLVIIPLLSIIASGGLLFALSSLKRSGLWSNTLWVLFTALVCISPAMDSLARTEAYVENPESRHEVSAWLIANASKEAPLAISGTLQLPPLTYKTLGNSLYSPDEHDPIDLFLLGYDRFASGNSDTISSENSAMKLVREFSGEAGRQRVLRNPLVRVFEFTKPGVETLATERALSSEVYHYELTLNDNGRVTCKGKLVSPSSDGEGYCWIHSRVALLSIDSLPKDSTEANLLLELMSPWTDQSVSVNGQLVSTTKTPAGEWSKYEISLSIEQYRKNGGVLLSTEKVRSPLTMGLSTDSRRLGVAIRNIAVTRR